MEFTGEIYGFYSDTSIDEVFQLLEEYALKIAYKFEYNTLLDNRSMIFYKDDAMWEYHLENGYNTDINEEGCFSLQAQSVALNGKATLYELGKGYRCRF